MMPILIPVSLRRLGAHLFDQQMWLWGQDIRHPESNALLRYGFQRHPSPDPRKAGSAYTWQDDRTHFVLWSFGLFAGQAHLGGLFLKRFQFAPRLSDDSQLKTIVWEPSALPRLDIPDPGD
ncbi:MAG TPA: hypothetical protein PKD72_08715, partial [Gemmatales bacterium]|nr:hypothetical protein [Gemmatales bacterium]